jgi:hypothetical protein
VRLASGAKLRSRWRLRAARIPENRVHRRGGEVISSAIWCRFTALVTVELM